MPTFEGSAYLLRGTSVTPAVARPDDRPQPHAPCPFVTARVAGDDDAIARHEARRRQLLAELLARRRLDCPQPRLLLSVRRHDVEVRMRVAVDQRHELALDGDALVLAIEVATEWCAARDTPKPTAASTSTTTWYAYEPLTIGSYRARLCASAPLRPLLPLRPCRFLTNNSGTLQTTPWRSQLCNCAGREPMSTFRSTSSMSRRVVHRENTFRSMPI